MGRESFGADDVARQDLRGGENGMYDGDNVHTASQRNLADKILENSGLELKVDGFDSAPYQPTAEGMRPIDTVLSPEQRAAADEKLAGDNKLELEKTAAEIATETAEIIAQIEKMRAAKRAARLASNPNQ